MGSYVPNTRDEQREMLREIGFADFEEMFSQIPKEVRFAHSLHLPEGMSEQGVIRRMEELAGKNKVFRHIFRGAGPTIIIYRRLWTAWPPRRNLSQPTRRTRRR